MLPGLPKDESFILFWIVGEKLRGPWGEHEEGQGQGLGREAAALAGTEQRPGSPHPVASEVDGNCLDVPLSCGLPGGSSPTTRGAGRRGHQPRAAPRTGLPPSSPGSPCEAAESRPLRLRGSSRGGRQCPCDTSLFLVPALPAPQRVSTPGVSFRLELRAFLASARGLSDQPAASAGLPRPAAPPGPRLCLLCLQSRSLRAWGQVVTEGAERGPGVFPTCLCCDFLSRSWDPHRRLVLTAV